MTPAVGVDEGKNSVKSQKSQPKSSSSEGVPSEASSQRSKKKTFKLKTDCTQRAMAEGARMPMTSDGTDERTSTSNLPETLNVMTSAQKAWINSGAKKRSLEDIAEEHKEASSSSNLNPVNIKKKKRQIGMLGVQVNDSSVDEAQQREETPWAFADGAFIQTK